MSQSILVTGGAGYVGSHACKALAGAGYRPVVYDNLSRGHREAVRWGPLVEGDLHDRDRLVAALRTHRVGAVRSEEHTSELQSRGYLVWRLLIEKKKSERQL